MSARFTWRRAVGALLLAAAVFFLARSVYVNWDQVGRYPWSVRALPLAASVALLALVLASGVWIWSRVLRHFGHALPFPALFRVWFLSNLARYIPGKIWQFVGAVQLSRGMGVSAPILLTSMLTHALFSLLAATVVAGILLPYAALGAPAPLARYAPLLVAAAVVLLVHPRVINTGLAAASRVTRKETLRWSGGWLAGARILFLSVLSWIVYGYAFFLFVSALVPLRGDAFLPLTAVNALAFVAGYFTFLPAGIGVREAAIALLLDPYVAPGVTAILAVASRLWIVAAELLGAGAALLMRRDLREESESQEGTS